MFYGINFSVCNMNKVLTDDIYLIKIMPFEHF
jgi:hypothetical protein